LGLREEQKINFENFSGCASDFADRKFFWENFSGKFSGAKILQELFLQEL